MKKALAPALLFLLVLMTACLGKPTIIQKPITWNAQRDSLTLRYLKEHYGIQAHSVAIAPKMIVLHWTAIPTFEKSFQAFDSVMLPQTRPDIKSAGQLNVSAHYLVDRDGSIYQLMPETTMARHVIGLNHCAIGIENVGGTSTAPLTKAQEKANVALVRYLAKKYPIDFLIGHYEYTRFEGHPLWLEKDQAYRTEKTDPGEAFMQTVRHRTKSLNLKPLPAP